MKNKTHVTIARTTALALACSLALAAGPVGSAKSSKGAPTLNRKQTMLAEGKTVKLKVKKNGATIKSTKWKSNDTDVATVNTNGLVKARCVGKAKITAKVKYVAKGESKVQTENLKCTVTVVADEEEFDGAWTTAEDPTITDEHIAMINEILNNKNDGVTYEPVALLATQVVAGTNYRFLCRKNVLFPSAKSTYSIVEAYKDLSGYVGLLSNAYNGVCDSSLEACAKEPVPGGWAPASSPKIPDVALAGTKSVLSKLVGATHTPVALVEEQVSAFKFLIICEYEIPGSDPGDNPPYSFAWISTKPDFSEAEVYDLKLFYEIM